MQSIARRVSPEAVGDYRVALRACQKAVHAGGQRSRKQDVIVVELGEKGRVDLVSPGAQRGGQVGLLECDDSKAVVRAELPSERRIPVEPIDHHEWDDADSVLGQHALHSPPKDRSSVHEGPRRHDHRYGVQVGDRHHLDYGLFPPRKSSPSRLDLRDHTVELDARRLPGGSLLEADLCIIGAGPAGIAMARELIGLNLAVLVLESGGLGPDEGVQELNEGTVVGGPYAGLGQTRHRGAGGATHLWNTPVGAEIGGKYVPLDPWDFDQRSEVLLSGWPFDRSHLEPFYERAQEVCGLGRFAYGGNEWSDGPRPVLMLASDHVITGVYQFGTARIFTRRNVRDVLVASNVRLCHHATACKLDTDGTGRRVIGAEVAILPERRLHVRARIFVLAAGAIENARLLLLSGGRGPDALGNRYGWVGRCFMEHPRDYSLTLIPRSPKLFGEARFFDAHRAADGTIIGGRLALQEKAIRSLRLPNASVTLLPREKATAEVSGAARRLLARVGRFGRRRSKEGYGWSGIADPADVFDAFKVIVNFEQRPNPENRVVLAASRDPLGVPRAEVHWRWRDEEQADLERLRTSLAYWLDEAGLGQLEVHPGLRPDPNAHHHAGTTRMHSDPRGGAVDADGRVHGMDNLYVTGASVFPTVGFANPTLTIVALALRLADHLIGR